MRSFARFKYHILKRLAALGWLLREISNREWKVTPIGQQFYIGGPTPEIHFELGPALAVKEPGQQVTD